ncbi:MAG: tRNA lysidine(34) synthetase TilS [Opitutales bacterium]
MKTSAALWSRRAEKLAGKLPPGRLHPAVRAWAGSSRSRGPWVVALSGGADSLALLLLLWAHWPQRRGRLCAVHFNHRLRGRAADRDETFCREVCRALGIKLWVGRRRRAQRIESEAQAREVRFQFVERKLRAARARVLWLGHQQNDVAETLLMRLARGSGAGGLAAPRPVNVVPPGRVQLRPLLGLARGEIEAALRACGIRWRVDASNLRGDFFRNRVRLNVVPAWVAASGRDAIAGAARSRELLEEDDEALEAWAARLTAAMARGRLALGPLAGVPRAVVRRVLHRWLLGLGLAAPVSRQAFDLMLDAVIRGAPTRHSLGREGFAVLRRMELRFASKPS